ncbi:hypothetical protein [Antarcticirhabdus aurantiaca]|uniref:DoxX family protein n=1 Tax=Antarcticirhabdus aurantiaca TaxID=2606717 RepID=A0ACD4NS76_9HYPH|nr:hypothetical protein [Antarcticirhabdus aurantiaca]WAJ29730.1 DoxX family protein [Jeongeuplla avenae]
MRSGSALVVADRWAWLGAGALGVFTALTIPIVHHVGSMTEEPFRTIAVQAATEHVGMTGALILVAILWAHRHGLDQRDAGGQPVARLVAADSL